ncbi:hypothetical protein XFF1815_90027 [Xanthomonas citri pv. fuscans]|nr:hypothetical protein XFF1815_90027 [Xanthomonas citri pv. fuscans]
MPALQRRCTNASLPPPAGDGARRADGGQPSRDVPAGVTLTAPTALIRRYAPPSPACGRRQRVASAAAALHQSLPFPRLRGKVPEGRMGGSRLAMFPQV